LNPDVGRYVDPDIVVLMSDASETRRLSDSGSGIAFASNFFEHLSSEQQVVEVLSKIHRIFKKGRKLSIIQPNVKYAYRESWNLTDHHVPLTENSPGEASITISLELFVVGVKL
jgi:predicted SAM-dependent methyltransferase